MEVNLLDRNGKMAAKRKPWGLTKIAIMTVQMLKIQLSNVDANFDVGDLMKHSGFYRLHVNNKLARQWSNNRLAIYNPLITIAN
jgi:hypothetical protein